MVEPPSVGRLPAKLPSGPTGQRTPAPHLSSRTLTFRHGSVSEPINYCTNHSKQSRQFYLLNHYIRILKLDPAKLDNRSPSQRGPASSRVLTSHVGRGPPSRTVQVFVHGLTFENTLVGAHILTFIAHPSPN